ncbi:glutamyl-tRNA(Gln) amidotransferase, A subunit [Methanocaldococcus infernus ME]|uniref:Glutamyl-tRNA(Gln) amidotransferase subunit A n=1 Tax=Methanocaldococcus infernus (strain DSM 11812 / JCM 15783 / ME) TaxID=573063 RepID=D5VS48_METIM|nr:Asp-tRNA(Asn)/Glu-tRNA(Gln) amidotransferase subunit GatA [Methanocaldococcus infernus]ADG13401.1 glutamyl-tRNA(Gln) amidotransferase, A subunit [Methanocaldococcus infernus ME]
MIVEKAEEYLERIEKNKDLNAFIEVQKERVLKEAERLEKDEEAKKKPLYGKIVAVKANINVEGYTISCASKTLENYVAPYNATVIEKLLDAGALIIGITNMDEFACGSSGETSYYGPTKNPVAKDRIPGGSSSGSAAAVSAELCDIALGSDTGGSIRNPSSHCGVSGFKPSYGVVSRHGLCDLAMSFDQIGPIAKRAEDLLLVMNIIKGKDVRDTTTVETPEFKKLDVSKFKVGVVEEFMEAADEKIRKEIEKGIEVFKDMGCEIVHLNYKYLDLALPTYYLINYVEFFSATRRYDGRRYGYRIEEVCGEEVLRRITIGSMISQKEYSGKYYKKALKARNLLRKEMIKLMKDIDIIVSPTVPKLPHKLGEKLSPMDMYNYDVLTVLANICGVPAGTVPCSAINGIPIGLQIMAKPFEDEKVLSAMIEFENLNK